MNFFDKVFLINLDSRPDRLKVADCHLKEQGIEYERFPAIQNLVGTRRHCVGTLRHMPRFLQRRYWRVKSCFYWGHQHARSMR